MNGLEIICCYQAWKRADKRRFTSVEVNAGYYWTRFGSEREFPRWRVSWIKATGELYACQPSKDRFILLGEIRERAPVDAVMEGWADASSPIYHNLRELAKRAQAATAKTEKSTFSFDYMK